MKIKINAMFKKVLYQMIFAGILLGLGLLIARFISIQFSFSMQEVISYVGFIFLLIGVLLSPRAGHTNVYLQGFGLKNVNSINHRELEVNRTEQEIERKSEDYYKNYFRYKVTKLMLSNISFLLTGFILLAYVILVA